MKDQVKNTVATAKRVAANGEKFVQATALFVVAGFSWYALHKLKVSDVTGWVVTAALVITGLRAAYEYIKFLDR